MAGESFQDYVEDAKRGQGEPVPDWEGIDLSEMDGRTFRPTNKPVPRLHIVERSKVTSAQYVHLLTGSVFMVTPNGQAFVLEFAMTDRKILRVTVQGRNLWKVFDYCQLHRWSYLRAADRDFTKGKEPIILSIGIEVVQEEQGEQQ